jgi:hypothetical protein
VIFLMLFPSYELNYSLFIYAKILKLLPAESVFSGCTLNSILTKVTLLPLSCYWLPIRLEVESCVCAGLMR